jgi:sulfatase modifying factor 1
VRAHHPCCTPGHDGVSLPVAAAIQRAPGPREGAHPIGQAVVPRHDFMMGDSHGDGFPADCEGPPRIESVEAFEIDVTTVTVAAFSAFVAATGYRTEAEEFGYSAVFAPFFAGPQGVVVGRAAGTPWWIGVRGSDWRHPEGPSSHVSDRIDHPVVHVSWNDAQAYCQWAGRRLPTEVEWEAGSRGGLDRKRYPWGDDLTRGGSARCRIWAGPFPTGGIEGPLRRGTVRADAYEANAFGLWQTVGNVWEWCADTWEPNQPAGGPRVLRGGSFLCHDSYCNRYRNSARSASTPDSSMANAGFRTVAALGDLLQSASLPRSVVANAAY